MVIGLSVLDRDVGEGFSNPDLRSHVYPSSGKPKHAIFICNFLVGLVYSLRPLTPHLLAT